MFEGGQKRCLFSSYPLAFHLSNYVDVVLAQVDIFAHDLILLPIHLGTHWCCATINFGKKQFQYYDSLRGSNAQCLSALRYAHGLGAGMHSLGCSSFRQYIVCESRDKRQQEYDLSAWADYSPKVCRALFRIVPFNLFILTWSCFVYMDI